MEQKTFEMGWLSPWGDMTPCGVNEHKVIARKILANIGVEKKDDEEALLRRRWVEVGYGPDPNEYGWRIRWMYQLSPEQRAFLEPYFAEDSGIKINWETMYKWNQEVQPEN